MVRHHFVEMIVRLAQCKYLATGLAPTVTASVQMFIKHVKSSWLKYDAMQWRINVYLQEGTEIIFK